MLPKNESNDFDFIDINPIQQSGHNCKVTALACLDQYWARQVGFTPIHVHKNNSGNYGYTSPKKQKISLREIAKQYGSCQGELLEIGQLEQLSTAIGYQRKTVHCDTFETFKKTIQENIIKKQPILCFFSVCRATGQPGFENFNHQDPFEHACIISGYNKSTDHVRISHWHAHHFCSLRNLYRSMETLPEERRTEYYQNIKSSNPAKKYDLVPRQEMLRKQGRTSITPAKNSGFKKKLIILERPAQQKMQLFREKLIDHNANYKLNYEIDQIKTHYNLEDKNEFLKSLRKLIRLKGAKSTKYYIIKQTIDLLRQLRTHKTLEEKQKYIEIYQEKCSRISCGKKFLRAVLSVCVTASIILAAAAIGILIGAWSGPGAIISGLAASYWALSLLVGGAAGLTASSYIALKHFGSFFKPPYQKEIRNISENASITVLRQVTSNQP